MSRPAERAATGFESRCESARAIVWKAKAVAALEGIADLDDREPIAQDIATLPG
jgi:hypothetical protein